MKPVRIVFAAALTLFSCNTACAQTTDPFVLHPLGHGVSAAIDNPAAKHARAGSNASFIIGARGVVVVDTFESAEAAQKLLQSIQAQTALPVRFVVNTHYHLDHVAGNSVFAATGAVVMAQDHVRAWERTENLKFFGPNITPQQRKFVETLGLPEVTYAQGATVHLGDTRELVLRSMPGHTGGDTVVYDAESNVVFCGDLFWNHTLPNLIDASTGKWVATLDKLLADYPTAAFVPGHGDEVGHAQDVRAFRGYLVFLRESIAGAQARGETGDAVVQSVLPAIKEKYGSWGFFDFAESNIRQTAEELRGVKKIPQPTNSNL